MIANITQGSFLSGIFQYNEKKIKEGQAGYLGMVNSFITSREQGAKLIFKMAEQSKRKDKFIHVSLNFPKEDKAKLTDKFLRNISKNYMTALGFKDNHPFMVYKHDDKDHPHIHLVASKITDTGKVLNDSYLHFRSQKITRALEETYQLTKVSNEKQTSLKNVIEPNFKSLKGKVDYHVNQSLARLKLSSLKEVTNYLNSQNIDIIEHLPSNSQKTKNIDYHGLSFVAITDEFKQNQKGIKASVLESRPTIGNLETIFEQNVSFHKRRRKSIKASLDALFKEYSKINITEFQNLLSKENVLVNIREDSKGNTVGISFDDKLTGYRYTGEKISKAYTAKNLGPKLTNDGSIKTTLNQDRNLLNTLSQIKHLGLNQQLQLLIASGYNIEKTGINIYIQKDKAFKPHLISKEGYKVNMADLNTYKRYKSSKIKHNEDLIYSYNNAKINDDYGALNTMSGSLTKEIMDFADQLFSDIMSYVQTPEAYYDNSQSEPQLRFRRRLKPKRKL